MKKVIGNKKRIILLAAVIVIFLSSLASCKQASEYQDEMIAIARFMKYYDDPENLTINILDKYEISDTEIYYYVEWVYPQEDDNETYELLLVYNPNTQLIRLVHFPDMEYGLYADVKQKWDAAQNSPDKSFSKEEISLIKRIAIYFLEQLNRLE